MREIGKEVSEKSKGLFSPEDWSCKSCGNINWARRTTCNVCNTPRVNTMGQRTGYGGGYMERDTVVEYRKRGDSDDEFDEFGRKKKRFRKTIDDRKIEVSTVASTSTVSSTGSSSSRSEEDKVITRPNPGNAGNNIYNDDDEEESGDDADLSKYDIWGAEDDDDGEKEKGTSDQLQKVISATDATPAVTSPNSHSASESESDSNDSSSSESSSASSSSTASSSGSAEQGSPGAKSRSRSVDSNSRVSHTRTDGQRASPRDGRHERSRSPIGTRS